MLNGEWHSAINERRGRFLWAVVCLVAWVSPTWSRAAGGALNLRDFGAVGDGTTNDAPALQAALDALARAGGGTLLVPPGRFAIQTPVTGDFLHRASAVVMQGVGSSSQLVLQTGEQADALTLMNAESILLDNLTFAGVPDAATDARIGLYFSRCLQAKLRRCDFYGIGSLVAGGAVIYSYWTDLRVEDCAFRGCSGNSAAGVPVIQNEAWRGLTITGTDFIDFGWLNGVYHSKTTVPALAWIRLGEPVPLDGNGQNRVLLSQVRMDEGAQFGLLCSPNDVPVAAMELSGVLVNGSSLPGARGVYINKTDSVRIEQSWFGYATRPGTAIELVGVRDAVLDAVRCEAGMHRIVADASVKLLTVRESVYAELQSDAQLTRIEQNGIVTLLSQGAPVLPPAATPPTISAVTVTPTSLPATGGAATITALVTGEQPLSSVMAMVTDGSGFAQVVMLNAVGNDTFSRVVNFAANPHKEQAQTFGITIIARDVTGGEAIATAASITVNAKKNSQQQNSKRSKPKRKRR